MNSAKMNVLKTFSINIEPEKSMGIKILDLLSEEKCLAFLQQQMVDIKAPNLTVTASMLSKRYAYLLVSSTLYSMVEFNGALHLPVKACTLTNERKLSIQADICKWQEVNSLDREQWRERILNDLFAVHVTPVLNIFKKTSQLSSKILWENVAIRINSIYRKTLAKESEQDKIKRLESDFSFLKNASGDLFDLKENPIKPYLKIGEEQKLNPYRKTCCMYHKLEKDPEGIGYCGICPIKRKREVEKV